jgi:UDPglucose--hexose-1-phosphate uridylyltransferase
MTILIKDSIYNLIDYSIDHKIIKIDEVEHVLINFQKLFKLNLNDFTHIKKYVNLDNILNPIIDYGYELNLFKPNTLDERDKFEALIFDQLMPSPMMVKFKFNELFETSSLLATKYLYDLSKSVNYIKTNRLKQNINYNYFSNFGNLEITINLAKPEKDPKDIALSKDLEIINDDLIPKCVLCKENEQNYYNARKNLRIVPITLGDELWHFQYSPYLYFDEHCIILHDEHRPMKINDKTILYLLDFVDQFDHYFIGSNADLPIVGGSILNHDHFQGGNHRFPIHDAKVLTTYYIDESTKIKTLYWPLSTIRIESKNKNLIILYYQRILKAWKIYNNKSINISSHTNNIEHNTLNPILRKEKDLYTLDIVLRNNLTTSDHPLGIFHPNEKLWHIKKENIGLIEAMGLAILPGRLKTELLIILENLLSNKKSLPKELVKHQDWYDQLIAKKERFKQINDLYIEVGKKFENVLLDCGVFKQDKIGQKALNDFIYQMIN